MFLSKLVLDPGHPQVRRDLANAYEMHRTLSRVYADSATSSPSRFLWRLEHCGDYLPEEGATVLLQAAVPGKWQRLQELSGYLRMLRPDKTVALEQLLQAGRNYVFRLTCNPTVTRDGKRYGLLREEEQLAWLFRQGKLHGFTPMHVRIGRSERAEYRQGRTGRRIVLQVVQFDGCLRVDEPEKAARVLLSGIGHAKALGLGMLSLAPAHS